MQAIKRRKFLYAVGATAAGIGLAGCAGEDGGEEPPEEAEEETPEEAEDEDGGGEAGDEPDYGDWFDDVENYDGTEDMTGQDEVEVAVGAGDNGIQFEPPAIRVDAGTTVVWEWTGEGGQHNVTEEDGEFESDTVDEEGHTFEHTFEEEGTYRYVCTPHEAVGMKGAVDVV